MKPFILAQQKVQNLVSLGHSLGLSGGSSGDLSRDIFGVLSVPSGGMMFHFSGHISESFSGSTSAVSLELFGRALLDKEGRWVAGRARNGREGGHC